VGILALVAVIKVRRVDGENVITLPKELEARGFIPDAEVTIEPLEDGGGIAVVLEGPVPERDRALIRWVVEQDREVLDRLEKYDRGEDA
jgi:hypothetical protein